jgi:hypothetical protein
LSPFAQDWGGKNCITEGDDYANIKYLCRLHTGRETMRDVILWHVLISARAICDRRGTETDANEFLTIVTQSPTYFAALGTERYTGLCELLKELVQKTSGKFSNYDLAWQ